jgi:nucleotide-binding universal stress UspA family protein
MSTVLAAIDATAASRGVLEVAKEIARVLGADVDPVHVIEDGPESVEEAARAAGLAVRLLEGSVAPTLVAEASHPAVAAVVVGLRRRVGGSRPAGHVALEVIGGAHGTVVVVPPATPAGFTLRTVLVPVQGRPAEALENVIRLARGARLDLVVLHVHDEWSIPSFEDQPHYDVDAWADEFLARWVPGSRREATMEIRVGAPAEEIIGVARERGADLIGMGWLQDLSPGRATIVRAVLERSSVPVALVPLARSPRRHPSHGPRSHDGSVATRDR